MLFGSYEIQKPPKTQQKCEEVRLPWYVWLVPLLSQLFHPIRKISVKGPVDERLTRDS